MFLVFLLLSFIFCHGSALATDEFAVSQNILYQVNQEGSAIVRQEVNITNNISQIYAKEYQFSVSGSTLENIIGGTAVASTNNTTQILVKFSKPVVGKGQTNQFFLNYSIPKFAQKKGNTWEIQLPSYQDLLGKSTINITLEVPSTFGDLSFASTTATTTHLINDITRLRLNLNQNQNKVMLIFGSHQLFDFKLNYYLSNPNDHSITAQIPIPPDTNYQTITLRQIDPPPATIHLDPDGNWLADYILQPRQEVDVLVDGQAKVHPHYNFETPPVDSSAYTQDQKYWPVSDPQISSLSQTLSSPQSIYKYTLTTLDYDYERLNAATRRGALGALNFPKNSLCTEFTDLFVTLARSKNIPSREIEGFAYSNNPQIRPTNPGSDILHAWPEYFDSSQQTWIQVDPTWEKTTNGIDYFQDLDLNHLTFVIHGQNSDSPPPPGSYKKNKSERSIFVDFAKENLTSSLAPPRMTLTNNQLVLTNPNLSALHSLNIHLVNNSWQSSPVSLPPLGSISFSLPPQSFFQSLLSQNQIYTFILDYQSLPSPTTQILPNRQHFLNLTITIGIAIFILCLGGIILTGLVKTHEKNS